MLIVNGKTNAARKVETINDRQKVAIYVAGCLHKRADAGSVQIHHGTIGLTEYKVNGVKGYVLMSTVERFLEGEKENGKRTR